MALTQISTGGIKDDAVTDAKLPANSVGNSEMKDDAVGVAELSATGTASSSTFLRGDNSWVTPTDTNTQLAFANDANNRVVTGDGSGGLNGEANLTFDGSALQVNSQLGIGAAPAAWQQFHITAADPRIRIESSGTNAAKIQFADNSSGDVGVIEYSHSDNSMRFNTNSGERVRIDQSGIITPKPVGGVGGMSMVGAFQARVTSTYDFSAGTAKINLGTEDFDANGWYDTSNSKYTPLCKGWYQLHFHLQFKTGINNVAIEMQLYPYFNGAQPSTDGAVHGWDDNYGNYGYVNYSTIMYFDGVDDYVEMYGNCSTTTDIATATRMSGYLVHPVA